MRNDKRNFARRNIAFTLIELLVVIAIISLLVSILLPSLTKAKDLARMTVCLSQWRGIGLANQYYAEEYGGYIPKPYDHVIKRSWSLLLEICHFIDKDDPRLMDPAALAAEEKHPRWGYQVSGYGMNQTWEEPDPSGNGNPRWHPDIVKAPSEEVVFFDNRGESPSGGPLLDIYDPGLHPNWWGSGSDLDALCPRMSTRHMGSPNVLFLDWHGEHVSVEQATEWSEYWLGNNFSNVPACWHPDWD
ncbi:MAG: type II secretion system protein [Phycisphaerae bacterium]|nr:type II secretion system protein [Phycisphaerae bacterium]